MKKQVILLVSILTIGLLCSGCKKKEEPAPADQTEAVTPTPTITPEPPAQGDDGDLVDMQASSEKEKNVIGTKSASALKVEMVNQAGGEIGGIYVRAHDSEFDDEEWGEELIKGSFTLKNSEKAVYYFEKGSGDEEGLYDLRVSFVEESRSEYFFRMIPLDTISRISFCVDEEDSGLPYAKYLAASGGREISTLDEVKRRMGYYDEEEDEEDSEDEEQEDQEQEEGVTPTPEPTKEPENPYEDLPNQSEDPAAEAENYIGKSLQELIDAFGEPEGNDYQDEPETGKTGYHYYETFTVSTTVDEDGNEVVAGVW